MYNFGLNFNMPSIDDVYEVRHRYTENLKLIGSPLLGYIIIIGGYALAPFLILLSIKSFKVNNILSIMLFTLSLLISIQIYANTGFKSVAFASIVSFVTYFVFVRIKNIGYFLAMSISIGTLLFILISYFINVDMVINHWFRRVFVLPGILVSYYFEYIVIGGKLNLENAARVISIEYFGTNGSANSGFIGSGLAKLNILGVFINSILLIIIMKIADFIAEKSDINLALSLFIITAYALANSSTTTIFLTYGFLFNCILLYIYPNIKNKINKK